MKREFDTEVERLFGELCELSAAERAERIAAIADENIRERVRSLLAAHDDTPTGFLHSPLTPKTGPWQLGPYHLERRLGWGGMGEVWLARQDSLDREVAVKVINPTANLDPDIRHRFEREGLAGRLRHPRIVHLIDMGRDNNLDYVVMDYIEGCTLRDVLQVRAEPDRVEELPPTHRSLAALAVPEFQRWVCDVLAMVADALHYTHENGIWHRDVKPDNILIDERLEPVLIDFGLAKSDDAAQAFVSSPDHMMGTVAYMSPEQAVRRRFVLDHRTDVFSLGVVLFECLTLTRPFTGESNEQVVSSILDHRPEFADRVDRRVSGAMAAVAAKAIRKKPANRFQTAREMAEAIDAVLQGRPIVPLPGVIDRLKVRASAHARPLRAAAEGALLVSAVIGTAWAYPAWSSYTERPRLDVSVRDSRGVPVVGAHVWLVPRTAFGRIGGAATYVGLTPVDAVRVREGRYWVQISHPKAGRAELAREFELGTPAPIRAVLRTKMRASVPMVSLSGGEAELDWDCVECPRAPSAMAAPYMRWPVTVPAFSIARYEASNREYEEFLADSAYFAWMGEPAPDPPSFWIADRPAGFADLPASGMTQRDARRFAEWAGGRLPTSLEWQYASRGPDGHPYPWGDQPDDPPGSWAVYGRQYSPLPSPHESPEDRMRNRFRSYIAGVAPVRAFPQGATPTGLHHMLGNVEEWTESISLEFDGSSHRADEARKMVIGTHWYTPPERAFLHWQAPNPRLGATRIGIRVLRRSVSHDRPRDPTL